MSGFQPAGRRWLLRGFLVGLPLRGSPPTHRRVGPSQGLPIQLPKHLLGTNIVYKIRQWSLSGAAVVPVLNVSSRVFWLELDDKALLDSYGVLQEGMLLGKAHVVNGLQ